MSETDGPDRDEELDRARLRLSTRPPPFLRPTPTGWPDSWRTP